MQGTFVKAKPQQPVRVSWIFSRPGSVKSSIPYFKIRTVNLWYLISRFWQDIISRGFNNNNNNNSNNNNNNNNELY